MGYQIITNSISKATIAINPASTFTTNSLVGALKNYKNTQSAMKDVISKVVDNMGIVDAKLHVLKRSMITAGTVITTRSSL